MKAEKRNEWNAAVPGFLWQCGGGYIKHYTRATFHYTSTNPYYWTLWQGITYCYLQE